MLAVARTQPRDRQGSRLVVKIQNPFRKVRQRAGNEEGSKRERKRERGSQEQAQREAAAASGSMDQDYATRTKPHWYDLLDHIIRLSLTFSPRGGARMQLWLSPSSSRRVDRCFDYSGRARSIERSISLAGSLLPLLSVTVRNCKRSLALSAHTGADR